MISKALDFKNLHGQEATKSEKSKRAREYAAADGGNTL